MKTPLAIALLVLSLCALAGCAGLGRRLEQPRVRVVGADFGHATLESTEVVFDFAVENPNALTLVLDDVGYRLRVNGEPFLSGHRGERAEIAARGESRVQLPVTVHYADVLRVLHSLTGKQRAAYDLEADFRFAVPVLGAVTVPVRRTGDLPLDRLRAIF